jgi:hypothetical protein
MLKEVKKAASLNGGSFMLKITYGRRKLSLTFPPFQTREASPFPKIPIGQKPWSP